MKRRLAGLCLLAFALTGCSGTALVPSDDEPRDYSVLSSKSATFCNAAAYHLTNVEAWEETNRAAPTIEVMDSYGYFIGDAWFLRFEDRRHNVLSPNVGDFLQAKQFSPVDATPYDPDAAAAHWYGFLTPALAACDRDYSIAVGE